MCNAVLDLQAWYVKHCDGNWEHQYGVKIETLDNPGWAVEIDLSGTVLTNAILPKMAVVRSEADWIRYSVEQSVFKGFGGPGNLLEIIRVFLDWANQQAVPGHPPASPCGGPNQ